MLSESLRCFLEDVGTTLAAMLLVDVDEQFQQTFVELFVVYGIGAIFSRNCSCVVETRID